MNLTKYCLILGFAFWHSGLVAQTECNTRALLATQQARWGTAPRIELGDNRGSCPNPFASSPPSVGSPAENVRTNEDVQTLMNNVRENLINDIVRGRPESTWSAQQSLMIRRIRNLKVRVTDCEGSGANYSMGQYIDLCRSSLSIPLPALVMLIGHEIGHSVDLCHLSAPYYAVDFSRPLEQYLPASTSSNESVFLDDLRLKLRQARAAGGDHLILTSRSSSVESTFFNNLRAQGLMTPIDQGIENWQNPAWRTYACLEGQGYPTFRNEEGRCNASEAGAQVWGARALALHLSRNPAPVSDIIASFACMGDIQLQKDLVTGKERDFNQIYMSEPVIQYSLFCQAQPNQTCMSHFGHQPQAPTTYPTGLTPATR